MNCFPCFSRLRSRSNEMTTSRGLHGSSTPEFLKEKVPGNKKADNVENGNIAAQIFTFRELATATKNFRQECLVGEGGFGRVYRAKLESGQTVAVKQLDRNGLQGNKEFLVEVLMLSLLHHQNLVNLVGYCADGDQRLLVYEYMTGGSLEDHLLDTGAEKKPLDWYTRMKIASGAARGLEYLHDKANPPVIYRDFKSSNILLDEDCNPKLSDFGLAKLGSVGDKIHVSSRVMGTYGYCAPEYAQAGELTLKSDVYSFGVVLLELITGRRAIDNTRPTDQQNLVTWAQPIFKDPKRYPDMADPILNKQFPVSSLNQAVAIASMCLQDESSVRPLISDVVTALSFLSVVPDTPLPVAQETCVKEVEKSSDHENIEIKEQDSDHNSESSDGETMDSDEYEVDEQSEDDRQRAVTEAKEWASSASFRSSQGSHNGSTPSSRNSSKRVQKGSSSYNSHVGLRNESISMSSNSGSSKKSLSHKSSSVKPQHGKGVRASKNTSSKKSHDDIGISLSASSSKKKSHDDIEISLSASSSKKKSHDDNGISLSASNSMGSQEGITFSILESSDESGDESHSSIRQLSHKSSTTKSQNKHGYVSHRLSHVGSTGSQNESVSSRKSSNGRSGNRRLVSIS